MVALTCYFDESFDEQVHVVAGYVASDDYWDGVFTPAWRKVIDDSPHPIAEFSAGDCFHGQKEFARGKGWTRTEREDLRDELISHIIDPPGLVGIATAFCIPGKADPGDRRSPKYRRQVLTAGYGISLGTCFLNLLPIVTRHSEITKIRTVVDKRCKFSEAVAKNWEFALRTIPPDLASKITTPATDDSKKCLPLQAADLLAFETFREVWGRCANRPVSAPLERLLAGAAHGAYCISYPSLEAYVNWLHDRSKSSAYSKVLYRSGFPALRASGTWNVR